MRYPVISCLAYIILLFGPIISVAQEAESDEQPVVIVSLQQTPKSLTRNALRAMFGMRLRNWPDQTPTQVFVLKDEDLLHIAFVKKILNIYPHQLRLAWDRLIFSGTGQAPITVSSTKEMLDRVSKTPGAVGYLPKAMVDNNVQILQIE